MSFEKIPYDKNRLEAIRIRLENHSRAGNPIAYAVSIDGMEIIPRTNDATLFETIYELLDDKTKSLSIAEYVGDTRNRNTTCFTFSQTSSSPPSTLQGFDPTIPQETFEERLNRSLEHASLKKDYDKSQRDNQTLKQQLTAVLEKSDQQEDRIKELEEENEELKKLTDENSQNNVLLQLGREAIEKWVGVSKKSDGPLAGTPEQPEPQQQQPEQNTQEKTEAPTHVAVPENEYNDYKFFSTLIQKFDPIHRGLVFQLVTHLSEHTEQVEETFMNAIYKNQPPHGNEEN